MWNQLMNSLTCQDGDGISWGPCAPDDKQDLFCLCSHCNAESWPQAISIGVEFYDVVCFQVAVLHHPASTKTWELSACTMTTCLAAVSIMASEAVVMGTRMT